MSALSMENQDGSVIWQFIGRLDKAIVFRQQCYNGREGLISELLLYMPS